jgi:hypothetical protein
LAEGGQESKNWTQNQVLLGGNRVFCFLLFLSENSVKISISIIVDFLGEKFQVLQSLGLLCLNVHSLYGCDAALDKLGINEITEVE